MQKVIDIKKEQNLSDIGFLKPEDIEFYKNQNNFLSLRYKGKDYKRVLVFRPLPLSIPDVLISVQDMDGKEIGIINAVDELDENAKTLIQEELDRRYYSPELTDILSIKEKMGFYYFDVSIGEYKKTFSIKNIGKGISKLKDGRIMLIDVDGNRYIIKDLSKISKKSARRLEPYLF